MHTSSASLPFFSAADETSRPSFGRRLIRWFRAAQQHETYRDTFGTNPNLFSVEFERRLLGQ